MNIPILVIESILITIPFAVMVLLIENKDPESMVADYPPDIQAAYYKYTGKEKAAEKLTLKNYVAKAVFMVVAFFVVVFLARLAGADSFWEGFLATAVYTLTIFASDTFILDWIFFPRVKRWRLPGTEHMDKAYAQKWFHVKACFPMIPVFVLLAAAVGGVIEFLR